MSRDACCLCRKPPLNRMGICDACGRAIVERGWDAEYANGLSFDDAVLASAYLERGVCAPSLEERLGPDWRERIEFLR